MSEAVRIELLGLGKTLIVDRGTPLRDVLFAQGVEFPCGGRGRCKGCRIKVLAGSLPVTGDDLRLLTNVEIAGGWRLACRAHAEENLTLELAQWEAAILADNSTFAFTPQPGLGIAVDLGTTTVVAQLLDLRTGHVLAVRTALNPQAQHGADVMSRVEFATTGGGQTILAQVIREQIGQLIDELLVASDQGARDLKNVVVVGNTVMHHLFCGINLDPLAHHPFEPERDGLEIFAADQLGWEIGNEVPVRFLPCLGGFVGSDILAGVLATQLHQRESLAALIDLGTNGEIVVGNRERLLCTSTAAGPAFEGARISMGMRAATGAISEVAIKDDRLCCHVLGNVPPRGICGSGLVDAVAASLELDWVHPSGRLNGDTRLVISPPVTLTQSDVRELQLAKGAIAAGLRLLVQQWGADLDDLVRIYLAGAFGNYINRASARRIGLIDLPPEKIQPAGNTALLGAKLALFGLHEHDGSFPEIRQRIQHVSLNLDPNFQEVFVDQMRFPDRM
ncbi:MAG: ASKHA domain-containing protein [Limisphaerales bacterium]